MTVEPIPDTESEISAAADILTTEFERITNEIEAFERFEKKVSQIDSAPDNVGSVTGVGYQQVSTKNRCLEVRTAYKETVMSVSHYEDEYSDTYPLSIKEEFGTDIAIALTKSSNFTPASKSALLDSIQASINERKRLRDVVLSEKESITTAHDSLYIITRNINEISNHEFKHLDFGALDAYRAQTTVLLEKCDQIGLTRQDKIDKIQNKMSVDTPGLNIHEYFYQSLSTNYPILSAIGKIGERINSLEEDIHTAIIYSNFQLKTY